MCADRLTHVNGERVDNVDLSIIRALVGGKSGTMVSLTFRPVDESNGRQITADVVRRGRPEKTVGFSEWIQKVRHITIGIRNPQPSVASDTSSYPHFSPSRRATVRISHTRWVAALYTLLRRLRPCRALVADRYR
jgi:hypothetical protein